MIQSLKNKIADFIIRHRLKHRQNEKKELTSFFNNSHSFLVIMPSSEEYFRESFEVLNFLSGKNKNVTVLTNDYRVSLLPSKFKTNVIEHGISHENKIGLPSKEFEEEIKRLDIHAVIDLNRSENQFYSYITAMAGAPYRIGMRKRNSDLFYNIQIDSGGEEFSYKNLVNCLMMF